MRINEVIHKLSGYYSNEIVTIGIYDSNGIRVNRYLIDGIYIKDQALEICIDIESPLEVNNERTKTTSKAAD